MKLQKNDHPVRLAFLGIVLTLAYVGILAPAGFLEGARLQSFDSFCRWRNTLQSAPPEKSEILLIAIDDESQHQLGQKWPVNRQTHAELIQKLTPANPKVIHFDLVFSGASTPASDQALAQAIREGPPVLLAAYMDDQGNPVLPYPLLTEAGGLPGLINKPRDRDSGVRRFFAAARLTSQPKPIFAIEAQAAALALGIPIDQLQLEPGNLALGKTRVPTEFPGAVAINYLLEPNELATIPYWQVIENPISPERFRDKIILVGRIASVAEIHHDVYPTSLGVTPGVMISANGILTLLSGQFLRPMPAAAALLSAFLLVSAIILSTYALPFLPGFLAALGLTGAGVFAAFSEFLFLHWKTESLSVILLGSIAWLTGLLYKHLLLVWESLRLHRQVITDPITGLWTGRYFRLRLESLMGKHPRPAGLLVVQTDRISELAQRMDLEEAQAKIRSAADALRKLQPNGLFGRLSEERFGVFLPGLTSASSPALIQHVTEGFRSFQGSLGLGLATVDQGPAGSAAELLQRAEWTCSRSWKKGRKTVELYDPTLDQRTEAAQSKETSPESSSSGLEYVASELEQRNRLLEKTLRDLRGAHKELEGHFLEVTKSLVMAMDTKDAYTAGHLERVSRYATRLSEVLMLPPDEIEAIREAALLHDIGKLNLPDEILHKTGRLTPEEVDVIKKHLELGAKILDPMKFFRPITTLLYHHHERYDGKGYPHGLTGEFIPPGAQIISIADSFDAMTTNRGYNTPLTVQEALEELRRSAGTQFNAAYVDFFIKLIQTEGPHLAGYKNHP